MKRITRVFLVLLVLVANLLTLVSAASAAVISLQVGQPSMTVQGVIKEIDPGQGTTAVIIDGRTFVPIRAIVEAMGGTMQWTAAEKKVNIRLQDTTVDMWIGKPDAKVNGQDQTLDTNPFVSATGRTMLPLRFVVVNLGAQVVWDGASKRITITYGEGSSMKVADFSGTWIIDDDSQKLMILTQSGNQVSGSYVGTWMVSGTVTGNEFNGKYYQADSESRMVLTMAADGKSFDGLEYYSAEPSKIHGTKQ